jgi:hypothetical protein
MYFSPGDALIEKASGGCQEKAIAMMDGGAASEVIAGGVLGAVGCSIRTGR